MSPTPAMARVRVGKFDPARVFPPGDKLTLPLLRLMLATDDARYVAMLLIMTDYQVSQAAGTTQGALSGGQFWYLFRLLCLHLKEAHNALNCIPKKRLTALFRGRPEGRKAKEHFRAAIATDPFVTNVRDSIVAHYRQVDIERVYTRDLAAGKVEGAVVACDVGVLSRSTITDTIALHLLDEAALGDGGGGDADWTRAHVVRYGRADPLSRGGRVASGILVGGGHVAGHDSDKTFVRSSKRICFAHSTGPPGMAPAARSDCPVCQAGCHGR